jgi:CRP/FNR family cyclic AMP-dependent transcriptional regulator
VSALPAAATVATAAADGSRSAVALLRVDAALREAVPAAERPLAERVVVVAGRELEAGQWSPDTLVGASPPPFAALLVRGILTHDVILGGRVSANLLGPGDLFRPWRSADTCLPCDARWTATGGAAVALLDERFVAATRRWPGLSAVVHERLAAQLENARLHTAIAGLPRVEERVLALFWHLADRWGIVRPDGVLVELALTHALIGHLVAAQRPTVSLALQALGDAGLVKREPTGAWLLDHDSLATLRATGCQRNGDGPVACAQPLPRQRSAGGRAAR